MSDLDGLLTHLEELLDQLKELDEPVGEQVFQLLDGIDTLHRIALNQLGAAVAARGVELADLRAADPTIAWLFDAYAVDVDERAAAEAAIDEVRPYLHSHGGEVELLDARDGIVHVRLTGACSGCTASDVTLREGIESALREHFFGFAELTVEEDDHGAAPHPPPGPTLLELRSGPPPGFTLPDTQGS